MRAESALYICSSTSDERSFSLESLMRVHGIATRKQLLPSHEVDRFARAIHLLQAAHEEFLNEQLVRELFTGSSRLNVK